MSTPTATHNYDEAKIKTLSSLEHIRKRTGMYIGRIGSGQNYDDGIYILLKEVIDNAIDEFIMGYGKEVHLRIDDAGRVEVRDFGRGIPLGKIVDCVSRINTGAKYNDEVFQFSVGLNGVGTKAVNALSRSFRVQSFRDGKYAEATFEQGRLQKEGCGKSAGEPDGTTIVFEADPEIFGEARFDNEHVNKRIRLYTYLNAGLAIDYNGTRHVSEAGLRDLIREDVEGEGVYPCLHFRGETLEIAFTHTRRYAETYFSFVNGQYTTDGGTHLSAFREGFLKAVNEFAKKKFDGEDVRDGLVGAIAIRLKEPVFESQTKNKLGNTEIRSDLVSRVREVVGDLLHRHPDLAQRLVRKVEETQKLRKELQAVKKLAREKARATSIRVPQLKDCKIHRNRRGKNGGESMIFLAEGQSAAGSIVSCRDPNTQAIFTLKGKPLNVCDLEREAIYKNDELYNLTRSLNIEDSVDNLRYDKVILATDADVDGLHIRNLLLTFFLRFFEPLVLEGHVFILETPLFRMRTKKKTIYCYSDEDRLRAAKELGRGQEITRFKGLGEISPSEFKQFIGEGMRLAPVEVDNHPAVPHLLRFYMGKNTPERRGYIMDRLVVEDDFVNGEQGGLFDEEEAAPVGGGPPGWRDDGRLRRLIDDNFVRYAAYVIRDRAIPDLTDGLKPVQRRILHSLFENDDGKLIKVANIVGHTMQYHPHGDASIADALVVLTNKDYLIEGQGNFGNILTGDPAAASRYIECRLTELARGELFNPELTRFVPSYDGRRQEPVALPCKLPLLLMMGAEGIAVGLSTRILPHNFGELLTAQIAILEKKPFEVLPDFRQGGLMDASEYDRGLGRIRLRAEIEQGGDDGTDGLIVRSVPFGTTTDSLIASIETAARKKKLAIRSIDDFTSERVEIRIVLKPGQDPHKAIHALYAFTQCEVALSSRIVVIHKNRPVEMDVDKVLRHNTRQLVTTLRRELESDRRKHQEQIHNKTLVQIFVENRIYKRIEECKTLPDVQQAVLDGVNRFRDRLLRDVTHKDVEMLLGIKIKRISRYDMSRNRKEIDDLLAGVERIEADLANIVEHSIRYLRSIRRKYSKDHPRRTQIVEGFDSIAVRDLTSDELTLRYDREKGYLGHEVAGDELFSCSSLDKLMVIRADGRYKVMNPPAKLFVDRDMPWCGPADRDRVFLMAYREEDGLTYIKRFAVGGTILNREYACTPARSRINFFSDDDPQVLYVRYTDGGGHVFSLKKVKPRAVKTLGCLLTSKPVKSIDTEKPEDWSDRRFGRPRAPLGL